MAEIGSYPGSSDDEDSDYIPDEQEINDAEKSPIECTDTSVKETKTSTSVVDDKNKAEELWKQFLSEEVNVNSPEIVEDGNSKVSLSYETVASEDLPNVTAAGPSRRLERDISGTSNVNSTLTVTNNPKKRGLNSLLSQVQNKKPKINTLQKSLMDWESFKKDEGICEDLQTFNKGKKGYLERQAFLTRSDVRSFEAEKSLRLSKKK